MISNGGWGGHYPKPTVTTPWWKQDLAVIREICLVGSVLLSGTTLWLAYDTARISQEVAERNRKLTDEIVLVEDNLCYQRNLIRELNGQLPISFKACKIEMVSV